MAEDKQDAAAQAAAAGPGAQSGGSKGGGKSGGSKGGGVEVVAQVTIDDGEHHHPPGTTLQMDRAQAERLAGRGAVRLARTGKASG